MKAFVLLLSLVAVFATYPEDAFRSTFVQWMKKFGKSYEVDELLYRYQVFRDNLIKIEEHNAKNLTWTMGMNQFTDLTSDEFAKRYLNGLVPTKKASTCTTKTLPATSANVVDWTSSNNPAGKVAVTAVKDQGQCGSCWSFSTTGAVEGAWALARNQLTALSEQQLMDCSWSYGNLGCNGGLMDNAFEYLIDHGGSCAEAAYPYTAKSSHTCKSCASIANISHCFDVPKSNAAQLQAYIAQQPVSIAIEADQASFQSYSGGVLTGVCGTNLDHGVLAVGFDLTYSTPYWKVKNSWGPSWGENGYIKIEIAGNKCGVTLEPSTASV